MRDILNILLIPAALTLLAVSAGCDKKDKYLRADPPSLEFDAQAQSATATIESSSSWYYNSGAAWLDVYADNDNPSLLHVVAQANESLSPREDEVNVVSGDALQISVRVFQRALDASIEVTPPALLEIDGRGTLVQTLTVTAHNVSEWAFTNRENWLDVSRGEGDRDNVLTVRADYSHMFEPRRDTIIIGVPREGFEAINDTIPVVQRGVNIVLIDATGNVVENIFEIGAGVTEIEFSVASAYDWTLTASGGAVPSATSGIADTSGKTGLLITVPENTGIETVEYLLEFKCGGESYPFTIMQSAPSGGDPLP